MKIKILLSLVFISLLSSFVILNKEKIIYNKVIQNSIINWEGAHLDNLGVHKGIINISEASILVSDGELTQATFLIDMSSIKVEDMEDVLMEEKLISHLSSLDFFNVSKFSNAKFKLLSIEKKKADFNVTGILTMLGIENEITFLSEIIINENKIIIKSEPFELDRTNWGVNYNKEGTEGILNEYIIRDAIKVSIDCVVEK